jgi:hypothetical protein
MHVLSKYIQMLMTFDKYNFNVDEDVLGESTSYIFKFYLFLTLLRNFNSLLHAGTFSFGGRH